MDQLSESTEAPAGDQHESPCGDWNSDTDRCSLSVFVLWTKHPPSVVLWRAQEPATTHASVVVADAEKKGEASIEASDSRPDRSLHPPRGAVLIGPFFSPPAGIATRHTVEARAGRSRTSAARTATIPPSDRRH
jgi:hypothetical protein